ncbi:integrase, catalytic region, zinc finger, CCHC-type containing protein [Tanacetum coccineum]|uniref:Integrase, catalytic region, zinc finger, CCHC-type containing protein n=1 Tax=Tanacetum coccineum TaxID=301880 RepID=A0ABQ5DKT5_9ASTR
MFSSNSTRVASSSSVSKLESKDSNLKKIVLLNTKSKNTYKDVKKFQSSVSLVSNKRDTLTSNVSVSNANVLNAKTINDVNDGSNLVIQLVLWIVDSGCSKHMTGNLKLLRNFVEKFMGTIRFGNDHFASINGYGDYGENLLTSSRDSALYTISISEMATSSPCLLNVQSYINKIMVRSDNGTEFKNEKLSSHYDKLGIMHQTSIARTPQQNGVIKRKNQTLVKVPRTMLIFSKSPEFLWVEAIFTACFTQNRSLVHTRYNKTLYELIKGRKPNVQYFHVFGSLCYLTNDRDDLGKMKPKADIGIFIGYSESSRGFRIYNRRKRKIMETIHVKFNELTTMASECNNSRPGLNCLNFQYSSEDSNETPSIQDLDNLFGPFSSSSTSSEEPITNEPTTLVSDNNADGSVQEDVAILDGNTFINPFSTHVLEEAESSLTYQDPSNMHEFYQVHRPTDQWTKNHPLEQVIGDTSKPVMTRSTLHTDVEMCMYALTMSTIEPKNIKEAMLDQSWIESMQEELNQFKRLDVWVLVERPVGRNIILAK